MNRTENPDLRHDADMAAFADMAKTEATFGEFDPVAYRAKVFAPAAEPHKAADADTAPCGAVCSHDCQCTRPAGHDGNHEVRTATRLLCTWAPPPAKPEPYIPGAEHLQMRWRCLREVVTGMQQASLKLADEFPASCEGDRADTLRLVLRAMRKIEAEFPGVTS